MSCFRILALAAVVCATQANAQILYTEDFDDGAGSTRWSAPISVQEQGGLGVPDDSFTDYAFDYSLLPALYDGGVPVPPAPNGDGVSTTGVFMQTNLTDQCFDGNQYGCTDEGESVGIVSNFDLPTDGNFKVSADVFLYWNLGGGSTEYSTFGVHHSGSANVPLRFNLNNGDGLAWQGDTDGDSGTDLLAYSSVDGETGLGGFEDIPNGTIPDVPTGAEAIIGIANQWVEMDITVANGVAAWFINGQLIHFQDDPFSGGGILLGQSDPFNSVNAVNSTGFANGVVFDNVVVMAIPEPAAAALLAIGFVGFAARRRR